MDPIKSREAILMRKNDAINMELEEAQTQSEPVQKFFTSISTIYLAQYYSFLDRLLHQATLPTNWTKARLLELATPKSRLK